MATAFTGWGSSWGDSWGAVATDPGALSGTARITLSATGTVHAAPIDPPEETPSPAGKPRTKIQWVYTPTHPFKPRRRSRRDELLLLRPG